MDEPLKDPIPGQMQLLDVEATAPRGLMPGKVPEYKDIVLTAEQIEQALQEWRFDKNGKPVSEKVAIHNMKMRVLARMRYEIVLDPISGRRAFGGPQPTAKEKKRVDETLADAAENRVQELINAMFAPIGPENNPMDRHKAAMGIAKQAREIRELELKEDELDRASGKELAEMAAETLVKMVQSGQLPAEAVTSLLGGAPIVDADVIEAA